MRLRGPLVDGRPPGRGYRSQDEQGSGPWASGSPSRPRRRSRFAAIWRFRASGSGPGIVLLQEIFGVNGHIRDVADLYAEEGYVVLAPRLVLAARPGYRAGL